jgi:branched-chain amino acid transport system substrate-binding protein
VLLAGCGEGSGAEEGTAITAYVEAPLCGEAERELARDGSEAGDLKVRVSCLPQVRKGGKLDLSQIGANARRATEDSSSIAYIAEPDKRASSFSFPILEEADIPQLTSSSGSAAISRLLRAIEESNEAGSLREAVAEGLAKG